MHTNTADVATDAVMALKDGQNVIIRVAAPGIGALTLVSEALHVAGIPFSLFNASLFDYTEVNGIPFVSASGEIKLSSPAFDAVFESREGVLIFDEVQAAQPTVQKYLRSKAERGRIVLILREHNYKGDPDDFASFRCERLTAQFVG